jgi:hypothetical protein
MLSVLGVCCFCPDVDEGSDRLVFGFVEGLFRGFWLVHDYIRFAIFRSFRRFLGFVSGENCVWGMLLYTGDKSMVFGCFVGGAEQGNKAWIFVL